jgi:hypothetical protein
MPVKIGPEDRSYIVRRVGVAGRGFWTGDRPLSTHIQIETTRNALPTRVLYKWKRKQEGLP